MDMDLIEELVEQPKVTEYVDKVNEALDGFLSLDAAKKRTGLSDQPPVDDWDWVEEAWNSDTARAAVAFFAMLVSYLFYSVFLQSATTTKPIVKKQQPAEDPLPSESQNLLDEDITKDADAEKQADNEFLETISEKDESSGEHSTEETAATQE